MKKILIIFALLFLSAIVLVITRQPSSQQEKSLCLITINGEIYNVESLRSTHPGGDIYICDSDMTETFNSKHGIDYTRLSGYKYTP